MVIDAEYYESLGRKEGFTDGRRYEGLRRNIQRMIEDFQNRELKDEPALDTHYLKRRMSRRIKVVKETFKVLSAKYEGHPSFDIDEIKSELCLVDDFFIKESLK